MSEEIRKIYAGFSLPISAVDCGKKCAPQNPSGKPFCCDICEAVPAAYESEWATVKTGSELWHPYRGDECASAQLDDDEMPEGMLALACLGHQACERENRLVSCRQFPFFPYVSSEYEFLGLAYDAEFEEKCWVISNLSEVSEAYRAEFIATFEHIFALFQDEFDGYALRSEEMRDAFSEKKRGFTILLRDGGFGMVDPVNESITPVEAGQLQSFGAYR
jgi:hypothetical protein